MLRLACFVLSLGCAGLAHAKDEWLCTEEASQIQDGAVLSCGVAHGSDENEARSKAFDNAKAEFDRVCNASDFCRGRKFTVEPRRNSCSAERAGYKCYRLLAFTIRELADPLGEARAPRGVAGAAPASFGLAPAVPSGPALRKSMPRSEVISALGEPMYSETSASIPGRAYLHYRGPACLIENSECSVVLDDGKVSGYLNFKPSNADEAP